MCDTESRSPNGSRCWAWRTSAPGRRISRRPSPRWSRQRAHPDRFDRKIGGRDERPAPPARPASPRRGLAMALISDPARCHPERRLPESKDLREAIFCCLAGENESLRVDPSTRLASARQLRMTSSEELANALRRCFGKPCKSVDLAVRLFVTGTRTGGIGAVAGDSQVFLDEALRHHMHRNEPHLAALAPDLKCITPCRLWMSRTRKPHSSSLRKR